MPANEQDIREWRNDGWSVGLTVMTGAESVAPSKR